MIWKIAKKEFLLNLMTFKFAVGTMVCVVLMAVFVPVLVTDYQQRLKDYNENVAANRAKLRKVKVYKNITPTVYRPPNVLSVFSEGSEKRLGNSAKIELGSVPEISQTSAETNPYHSIFPTLDVSLIFKIVMSVLALLVAYDVISGERERGTLRLIMSSKVARYQVLLGKLLAGLMTLAVPITIAFIVGLLILEFFPMVDLAGSDWVRIGLIYATSLIFTSALYNIGAFFSCLTRTSAISLVLSLLFWIVCIVVIPNGSVYLAKRIGPLERDEKIDSRRTLIQEDLKNKLRELRKRLPRGGPRTDIPGAFGPSFVLAGTKSSIEYSKKRYPLQEPLRIKYADKLWEIERLYLNSLSKQKHLARNLSCTSPIAVYENLMSALAGTDLASSKYFMDRARTHRNEVIDYIRSQTDDFSMPSYFTRCKEGDWLRYREASQLWKQLDTHDARMNGYYSWGAKKVAEIPSLGLQDLPQFVYKPRVSKSLEKAIPDLALLIFVNVFFFALSFVAFVRYDVR